MNLSTGRSSPDVPACRARRRRTSCGAPGAARIPFGARRAHPACLPCHRDETCGCSGPFRCVLGCHHGRRAGSPPAAPSGSGRPAARPAIALRQHHPPTAPRACPTASAPGPQAGPARGGVQMSGDLLVRQYVTQRAPRPRRGARPAARARGGPGHGVGRPGGRRARRRARGGLKRLSLGRLLGPDRQPGQPADGADDPGAGGQPDDRGQRLLRREHPGDQRAVHPGDEPGGRPGRRRRRDDATSPSCPPRSTWRPPGTPPQSRSTAR